MTHNEQRSQWYREGAIGLGVGILYGTTNVCIGHPFDTIKTKMQAQKGFENTSMVRTFLRTLQTQGVVGLYRGCVPPLWGSGIYRSTQFAVFEAGYTYLDNPIGKAEIPFSGQLQLRVVVAGMLASTSRAIIETPLEYAKIRRQTGQTWQFRKLYTGFGITWVRTMGLMTTYFILVDSGRRHFPEMFSHPVVGPFMISGVAATLAWWIVWPFEYMKAQVQSSYGKNEPVLQRMARIITERGGFFSLYRGIVPGSIRSFLANGTSMVTLLTKLAYVKWTLSPSFTLLTMANFKVVMVWAQRQVTKFGLRGEKKEN